MTIYDLSFLIGEEFLGAEAIAKSMLIPLYVKSGPIVPQNAKYGMDPLRGRR